MQDTTKSMLRSLVVMLGVTAVAAVVETVVSEKVRSWMRKSDKQ